MNADDAKAKENNVQLTLSPNLSLEVNTRADARKKLAKDEFKQVGSLLKGIIAKQKEFES